MNTQADFRLAKIAEASFPTGFGHFRIFGFEGHFAEHVEEAVEYKRPTGTLQLALMWIWCDADSST